MAAGTVVIKILGDATNLSRVFSQIGHDAESALSRIGGKMQAAGKQMTLGLTAPIVGGFAFAAKAFGDFEQTLNTFQAVSGATGKEMEKLSTLAKQLGKDAKLPGTSAADAALAMTELAKAGLTVGETMAATRGVLQLSAAAQIDNATAATYVATALNAFNLEAKEANRISDLLAGTANASSAEINDVADAMSQAAAVFAGAKVPVEDLSTMIGLLANNGIKGSDAGTSLKSALLALQTPSKQQAAMMREVNFELYDGNGKMKTMREVVGNLESSMKGLTQQRKDEALGIILGSDAVRAGNILLAEGVVGYDKMREAVTKQGSAQEVAEAKTKGFNGKLEALKSSLETLAITIGEQVVPVIEDIVGWVQKWADKFDGLSATQQKIIIVIALVVAAIGPLVWIIGTVMTAISGLQTALVFLAANPVVLLVAAIAALAAGFVIAYQKSETFRDIVNAVIQAVVNYFLDQVGFFLDAVALIIGGFARMAEAASKLPFIGDKFDGVAESLRNAQKDVEGFADAAHKGIDLVTNDAERATEGFRKLGLMSAGLNVGAPLVRTGGGALARAAGGPVWPGQAFLVGERGPELFVPGQAGGIIPNGAGGGGGGTTIIQLVLDGKVVTEVVHNGMLEKQRRTGALGLS